MLGFLIRWIIRGVLFAAGLIFAASLLVLVLAFALLRGLRAAWARLIGQPVTPWVMRMNPRDGWRKVYRAGHSNAAQTSPRKRDTLKDVTDVTDVEVK